MPTSKQQVPPANVHTISDDKFALSQVLKLAKTAKATVGFLPDAAFEGRARSGTLTVAELGDAVVGYLLYDLPREEIRIVQLVVVPQARGKGIARALIDRLAETYPDRRGVYLHCRNDFDASKVWPRLDFLPVGERKGRSADGALLTKWQRSFGQPDLFTYRSDQDSRPIAMMDSCVFFDRLDPASRSSAKNLSADWIDEHVCLAVTDHLFQEISRGTNPAARQSQRAAAEQLRLPQVHASKWRTVLGHFENEHPRTCKRDIDDLTHAAQSIALEAEWLVTSDERFRTLYAESALRLGQLQIVSPAEFVRQIDELAREDRYRPSDLAATDMQRHEVHAGELHGLAEQFVNHEAGEHIRDLRAKIEVAGASAEHLRLELVTDRETPRALIGWSQGTNELEVSLVRVAKGAGHTTIARHALATLRDHAAEHGCRTIRIVDSSPSRVVRDSFESEGFAPDRGGVPVAHVLRGVVSFDELLNYAQRENVFSVSDDVPLAGTRQRTLLASELEQWFAPVRVVDAGIRNYYVPIQHGWATDLLDVGLAEEQLLPRAWGLGLRRELVYFRSPLNSGGLRPPARLVWYVSGKGQGAGTVRAVSHLTEVVVDSPSKLFNRFRKFGVYEKQEDIERVADAKTGRVMALRFCSTVALDVPIPLDTYREIRTGDPRSRHLMLQTIDEIPEVDFLRLMELGTRVTSGV